MVGKTMKRHRSITRVAMSSALFLCGMNLLPQTANAGAGGVINKDSANYYLRAGKEQQDARKYSDAWKYYERAAKFDPTNLDAQMGIADVCMEMNRMAPAIKALEEANRMNPTDDKVLWKLTKLYFKYGQYQRVIDMAPKIAQRKPDAKNWSFMLGKSYYSVQNYGQGIELLKRAVKEDPENGEAFYLIAHMYTLMSNYKPALPYFEQALALEQESSYEIRVYEYAMVLATVGNYDESIKWFQKALDKGYKARDEFYMNYAYTLADAHKTDKAIEMMEGMLKRRPQDIALLDGLADICYHSGRYKQAIQYWDKVLAFDEKNARPLYHIGLAYIKMGNTTDGQQLCDKAIAMDPSLGVLKHEKRMQ